MLRRLVDSKLCAGVRNEGCVYGLQTAAVTAGVGAAPGGQEPVPHVVVRLPIVKGDHRNTFFFGHIASYSY